MKESNVQNLIRERLGALRPFAKLHRNNTAQAWGGRLVGRDGDRVIIEGGNPVAAGLCKGSSDLIGWTCVEITPDMVGCKAAIFTAIEVKTETGKATPEQLNFIEQVRRAGGFAGIARNPDEAVAIVDQKLPQIHP